MEMMESPGISSPTTDIARLLRATALSFATRRKLGPVRVRVSAIRVLAPFRIPRDYSRWQRLIIPRKVHPPIMVSRRAATSSLLRILRCYVIITDNRRRFLTDTLHAHLFPGLDRGGVAGDGEEERRFSMMKSNARRFAEHRERGFSGLGVACLSRSRGVSDFL